MWRMLKTSGGIAMHFGSGFAGLDLQLWAVRAMNAANRNDEPAGRFDATVIASAAASSAPTTQRASCRGTRLRAAT